MKWFRSNIRRVSHVALFALAIQFALSFGHFHGVVAQDAFADQSDPSQSEVLVADKLTTLSAPQPASDQGSPEHPGDICAICAVMAMANTMLFATPPVVLLPRTIAFSYMPAAAEFVRIASVRAAFQPRAPPVS